MNKEYTLHYYGGEADPYVAKFTIAFVTSLDEESQILSFEGDDFQMRGVMSTMKSH